jgi:hypothetical protein
MNAEEFFWVLALVKNFWTLTPQNQNLENTRLRTLLINKFWWDFFWNYDNLPFTYEKHS